MNHYRKVPRAQWAAWSQREADPSLGVGAGPMSEPELADRDVLVVGEDLDHVYLLVACHGDPVPGRFPGWALSCPRTAAGRAGAREAALPPSARLCVLRTRVWRAGGRDIRGQAGEAIRAHIAERAERGLGSRFTAHEVPIGAVLETDAVEEVEVPPARWAE